jgi:predicted transcriptional regulator
MANSTIGVRLSEDTRDRLEAVGKARDRTPHYLMKSAIERFLEMEEALEAERQLVNSRWQKFELTGETVDHADVKVWAAGLLASGPETG